jgi:hypothetical protein
MTTATVEAGQASEAADIADGYATEAFGAQIRRDAYATAYRLRRQILPHAITGLVLAGGFAAHAVAAAGAVPAADVGMIAAAASVTVGIGAVKRVSKRRRRWARRTLIGAVGASAWLAASPYGVGPEQAATLVAVQVVAGEPDRLPGPGQPRRPGTG